MKLLSILVLLFAGFAYAQTPGPEVSPETPYGPYEPPTSALVCHTDKVTFTPIVDEATGKARCFLVPPVVSQAFVKWMLTQRLGLTEDGKPIYEYASWWDLIVKHFIKSLVSPVLDMYPSPEVAQAKAAADAAVKAVDAAKLSTVMSAEQPQ